MRSGVTAEVFLSTSQVIIDITFSNRNEEGNIIPNPDWEVLQDGHIAESHDQRFIACLLETERLLQKCKQIIV